uniref:Serine/threonine-protein phosphatase PGAM5, mitochondrial n=1 Tax=Equus asinus TaxID=9793 RepID=A0A8C4MCH3_EQUAS
GVPAGLAAGSLRPGWGLGCRALLGRGGGQAPRGRGRGAARGRASGVGRACAPEARCLGPQLGQARTTVPGQPAEEEPGIWRRGTGIQAGPLQSQGHAAHLPHQALPVPCGCLPGKGPHSDAPGVFHLPGREQAELTGLRLASLGLKFNKIVHSSMTRAVETTDIISKHLPGVCKVSTDLLREGAPIEPDPPVSHWKPEAVQYYEDGARIEAAFRNYIHRADAKQQEDSYEIFICHANVIRYIVCRALQFPPEGWLRLSLNNGSITHLVVRPDGRVALRTLGDTGFMPPDKISRS